MTATFSNFSYRYDKVGNFVEWKQGQETVPFTWALAYDGADQLSGVNRTAGPALKPGEVQASRYGYDLAGNRTVEERDGQAVGAKFNGLNQMTSRDTGKRTGFAGTSDVEAKVTVGGVGAAVQPEGRSYRWRTDLVLRDGPQTIPVEAENAAGEKRRYEIQMEVKGTMPAASPESFTYDENGNLTAHSYSFGGQPTTTTYDWDASNRLIGVTTGNVRSLFGYNGRGQRVRQIEQSRASANAAWTTSDDRTLIWNGMSLKCERSTSTGGELIRHWANGWQAVSGTPVTLTSHYYLRDHLGSVREVIKPGNQSGVLEARYSYDAWGRVRRLAIDTANNLGTVESPLGYTGHYRHVGTGLHLAFYRAYDAELGRWVNRDPQGMGDGVNIYSYCKNAPSVMIDPLGLEGSAACCDKSTRDAGAQKLRSKYNELLAEMQSGALDADVPKTCYNWNGRINNALVPPKCWTCWLQHGEIKRAMSWMESLLRGGTNDHWVVICQSNDQKGNLAEELMFDAFSGSSDLGAFRNKYPYQTDVENKQWGSCTNR